MENQIRSDINRAAEQATGTLAKMKEQAGEKAGQAREAVVDLGRKTVDSIDVHQQADRIAGVAHVTADKLQETADYVRKRDLKSMAEDAQDLVRRYPGPALAVAATIGFLVARGLRTQD